MCLLFMCLLLKVTIESTFENVYGHPCFCFAPPDLPVPVATEHEGGGGRISVTVM
jgi:hypothetical protein